MLTQLIFARAKELSYLPEENKVNQNKRTRPPRKRRRRSVLSGVAGALLYVLVIIGTSAILASVGWAWANDVLALNKEPVEATITLPDSIFHTEEVEVEKENLDGVVTLEKKQVIKADIEYVANLLEENGLIEYPFLFKIFAVFTKADTELSAGIYKLNSDMDYSALLTNLGNRSTAREEVTVTIPEGYTIDQIFELLEEKGVASVKDLQEMAATHDYKFEWLVPLDIPLGDYHRLEGFLFPDTYKFYVGHDPLYVINKMLQGFDKRIMPHMETIQANETYDLYELVTIASLIEKETDGSDQAIISSVIYNRLNSNVTLGKLQIDATLAYINGGKIPTEADKTIDSPYNTYLYAGLPEGPIACPGMAALYAAMNPKETGYYYYVLNPETNKHEFTKNYDDHVNLVNRYANYKPAE